MTHRIKLLKKYANDVLIGLKTFEIRENDRDYKVKDLVNFVVVNDQGDALNHPLNNAFFIISYLLKGPLYGLKEGYVAFALQKLTPKSALILNIQSFIADRIKRAKAQQGENFTCVLYLDDWEDRWLFAQPHLDIVTAWKEELRYLSTRYDVTRCGEKWLISNRERENKGDENGVKNEQT